MKTLRTLLVLLALPASGAAVAAATPPSLYSFADVYRLTVAGEPFAAPRWVDPEATQVRLVSSAAIPELRFSVSTPRDSQRWALALAGLAACAWVAHRRLSSPY